MLTLKELAGLVEAMRKRQSEYFRTRNHTVLNECRNLERHVDEAVQEILHPAPAELPFGDGDAP